jgi:hypothetical protein
MRRLPACILTVAVAGIAVSTAHPSPTSGQSETDNRRHE